MLTLLVRLKLIHDVLLVLSRRNERLSIAPGLLLRLSASSIGVLELFNDFLVKKPPGLGIGLESLILLSG